MAEAIFNAMASEKGSPYVARSAGVAALEGKAISFQACEVLREIGIPCHGRPARQVSEAMLEDADLVLAMTPEHAATLRRLSQSSSAKVNTLLGYTNGGADLEGIPDPHGQSKAAHRASVRQLFHHMDRVFLRLREEQ